MNNHLHIVCLDAPSPPDYGGAIDMFYKIKALAETGYKINLHYFNYRQGRGTDGLKALCMAAYSYPRKPFYRCLPFANPYIISSRINQKLIERLNKDEAPVLLEGLHCAGLLPYLKNNNRVVVRMHNEEASYYNHLASATTSSIKKSYFLRESRLLQAYQMKMNKEVKLACLSDADMAVFRRQYGFQRTAFVPCFIPWQKISSEIGSGNYCLYHGNMQVSENEEAALWLVNNVFSKLKAPLVIAGRGISKKVTEAVKSYSNVSLINNPSMNKVDDLVSEAHINVLPSMNSTGVKLKLLNALFNGRYCLTNFEGVKGSQLSRYVHQSNSPEEWLKAVKTLMQQPFEAGAVKRREEILGLYDNKVNAKKLSELW